MLAPSRGHVTIVERKRLYLEVRQNHFNK